MNVATKYLLTKYLKSFFVILISLELFFNGIDIMQHISSLPKSANLQLLYVLYNAFFTLTIALPLSIVFAWIVTLSSLIKENILVSFYSLGISPWNILRPIITVTFILTSILITLQTTPLAYSYENKMKILSNRYFINEQRDIFLKYNEYFVYFKRLYPYEKKAYNIHIFKIKNKNLLQITKAAKAMFLNNEWIVSDAIVYSKPAVISWDTTKINIINIKEFKTLKQFEPSIINNVYKGDAQYSVKDAIKAILVLTDQDFNTNKIKSILYSQVVLPFFVLPLIILIFLFVTPSNRFFNSALFLSISIFLTLMIWGILFLLQKLSLGDVILAEVGILLPIAILYAITFWVYRLKQQ